MILYLPACRRSDAFKCNNGMCLPSALQCNGVKECTDGSDESTVCGMYCVERLISVKINRPLTVRSTFILVRIYLGPIVFSCLFIRI